MKTTLPRLHRLLAIQSLVVILVSVNRLSTLTLGYLAPNEFLRWVDFLNMIPLPLISLVGFYLVKKEIEASGQTQGLGAHLGLNLAFLIGVYLLGVSYGAHEITNYLHGRFCAEGGSRLCEIVAFQDDEFSHWVFFTGFVLVNASLLFLQTLFPYPQRPARRDRAALIGNGLFIGLGIFANLAFEQIGLDLYVVALLAGLAVVLHRRYGPQPLVLYYLTAYLVGLAATTIVKLLPA